MKTIPTGFNSEPNAKSTLNYAVTFPSSPRSPIVPTCAHINKLMIIAKGESHTQSTQTNRKGKLE